jgi:hypothetical protein
MTMAAAIEGRTAQTPAWSKPSRIAAVDILAVLGQAETIWREFEEQQQSHTPYQRFDFINGLTSSPPTPSAGLCCCSRSGAGTA